MLPDIETLHRAVKAYVLLAYGEHPPERVMRLTPPGQGDTAAWLMAEPIERDPPDAPLNQVRSFILRLGNQHYPHMKVRLTRPANQARYVLSIDAHDVFLHAPAGTADEAALEALKRYNATLAQDVMAEWDRQDLPTERQYMRRLIEQARGKRGRES
jgi:hypothetical protein